MDPLVLIAVAAIAAVAGAVVGMLARGFWASQSMKAAQAEARRIEAEARARQKELILEAKDEKLRLQREAEDEARAKRNELSTLERRLLQRDEQLDQRTDMLEQRDRKLLERERELDVAKESVAKAHQEQVAALERVSGVSADDAKGLLLEAVLAPVWRATEHAILFLPKTDYPIVCFGDQPRNNSRSTGVKATLARRERPLPCMFRNLSLSESALHLRRWANRILADANEFRHRSQCRSSRADFGCGCVGTAGPVSGLL